MSNNKCAGNWSAASGRTQRPQAGSSLGRTCHQCRAGRGRCGRRFRPGRRGCAPWSLQGRGWGQASRPAGISSRAPQRAHCQFPTATALFPWFPGGTAAVRPWKHMPLTAGIDEVLLALKVLQVAQAQRGHLRHNQAHAAAAPLSSVLWQQLVQPLENSEIMQV